MDRPQNVIQFSPPLRGARVYDLCAHRYRLHPQPTLEPPFCGGVQLEGWVEDGVIVLLPTKPDDMPPTSGGAAMRAAA